MPKFSSNLAYAIGLITTDGCLYSDQRHISLVSADKQLIETFNKCLGKTNRITINPRSSLSKNDSYRVQIEDVKLFRWLSTIGLFPNKSLTLGKIKINDRFFPDFLRGHLDGDGSIVSYEDKYLQHINPKYIYAWVVELAYTRFSKSRDREVLRVQLPPQAQCPRWIMIWPTQSA